MQSNLKNTKLHLDTRLAHVGRPSIEGGSGPVNVPVVRTSTVRFDSIELMQSQVEKRTNGEPVSTYGRQGMETQRALEQAVCSLEGGSQALLTPSGLSAISLCLLSLAGPGDHILVTDSVYQPVRKLEVGYLARIGVQMSYFDPFSQSLESQLRSNTKVVYVETPGSLLYEVIDLEPIVDQCKRRGILVVVDNTWASGYLFNPLKVGADVSLIAGTKYISGHSDLMIGVVVSQDTDVSARLKGTYNTLGLAVSPDDAFLALRGLRTLAVRMQQHQLNALQVAEWLAGHERVKHVYCPALQSDPGHELWRQMFRGTNGLLSVAFKDLAEQEVFSICNRLNLFDLGASWGGFESLVLPASAAKLSERKGWSGETGVLRLNIGLENAHDLISDLDQAISASR